MKKKCVWFLMVLLFAVGELTLIGCSKDNEEEDNLGASRPIL